MNAGKFNYNMACCVMIMIVIIRLIDSALSIVEWYLLIGILLPLSLKTWQAEFAKYQAFPEYKLVNYGMALPQ